MNSTQPSQNPLAAWQARWTQLAPRERRLLTLTVVVVLAAVLWLAVLGPALRVLRTSTAQAAALDAQLQRMQTLQAQAKALQQQAPLGYDDAVRALKQSTQQTLGTTAQINISADRATVTLQAAGADALAQWLAQARLNARSVPLEARINRISTPAGTTWSGVMVMGLPPR